MWHKTSATELFKINYPILQAPMAGGATTPELVSAVSHTGGLGGVGAGLLDAEQLDQALTTIKQKTDRPFQVNLFTPEANQFDPQKCQKIQQLLKPFFEKLEVEFPQLKPPYQININERVEVLLKHKVPIVSFTFGIPDKTVLQKLKQAGTILIGTATTVAEAQACEKQGFDAVVAQGVEAGGHRGTFLEDYTTSLIGTMALAPQIVDAVKIPVIAAGGIMDGRGIAAALCLGASAVQMGTAFLTCKEAGIANCYKKALLAADHDNTVITKAFTGRPARGIRNTFTKALTGHEANYLDYPIQGRLTKPLRQAAAKQGNAEFMSLWAR